MAGYRPANRGNRTPAAARVGQRASRKLRAAGWNISPSAAKHKRDGIFVSAMGPMVSILVDTGNFDRNKEAAIGIADQLTNWGQNSPKCRAIDPTGEWDAWSITCIWKD